MGERCFSYKKSIVPFFLFSLFLSSIFFLLPLSHSQGLLFVNQVFYYFAYLGDINVVIMLVKHV